MSISSWPRAGSSTHRAFMTFCMMMASFALCTKVVLYILGCGGDPLAEESTLSHTHGCSSSSLDTVGRGVLEPSVSIMRLRRTCSPAWRWICPCILTNTVLGRRYSKMYRAAVESTLSVLLTSRYPLAPSLYSTFSPFRPKVRSRYVIPLPHSANTS